MCAPIRTALAEASISLVRSLSEYPLWKDQIASAILEGLQEVRNTLLSSTTPDKLRQSDQQGSTDSNFNGVIEVVLIFFFHGVLNALHRKWFWSFVLLFHVNGRHLIYSITLKIISGRKWPFLIQLRLLFLCLALIGCDWWN